MDTIIGDITATIHEIDLLTELLISGVRVEKNELLSHAALKILKVFPSIVESYMQPELKEVMDDMSYWINQMERVTQVLSGQDRYLMIDVLFFETKNNLIIYSDMIQKAGIQF